MQESSYSLFRLLSFRLSSFRLVVSSLLPVVLFLWLFSILLFALFVWLPGDIASTIFATEGDEQTLATIRATLELEKPFTQRYRTWLYAFLQGDWGKSEIYGLPVKTLIAQRLPISLTLSLASFLLASVFGIILGVWMTKPPATNRALAISVQGVTQVVTQVVIHGVTQLFIALPSFLVAIALILIFAVHWQLLPTGGVSSEESWLSQVRYLLLPTIALALPQIAILARFSEAAMRETLNAPFITTARAKGLTTNKILIRQALPVAAAPILALSGMQCAFLISGTVIVENVFALPGLGSLFLNAALARDIPLVLALAIIFAAVTLLANAIAEMLAKILDPRRTTREIPPL